MCSTNTKEFFQRRRRTKGKVGGEIEVADKTYHVP